MGAWLERNGKAIYNTRKWIRTCQWSEGKKDYKPQRIEGDFKANGDFILKQTVDPDAGYAIKECFFTTDTSTGTVFAILPRWPANNRFVLKDMQLKSGAVIRLLETNEILPWKQTGKNVIVRFPEFRPDKYKGLYAYAISIL